MYTVLFSDGRTPTYSCFGYPWSYVAVILYGIVDVLSWTRLRYISSTCSVDKRKPVCGAQHKENEMCGACSKKLTIFHGKESHPSIVRSSESCSFKEQSEDTEDCNTGPKGYAQTHLPFTWSSIGDSPWGSLGDSSRGSIEGSLGSSLECIATEPRARHTSAVSTSRWAQTACFTGETQLALSAETDNPLCQQSAPPAP